MKILLINKDNKLPSNYKPVLEEVENGYYMQQQAARCMKKMLKDARADGIDVVVFSAYRNIDYQKKLFDEDVQRYMNEGLSYEDAYAKTALSIALPGASEHNAGLAADLSPSDWEGEITEEFELTEAFKWLHKNSWKYGFILRHPKNKTHITKYNYEPWHYRYVGCPHAEIIMRKGLALEEYLAMQGVCPNCKFN